MEKYDTKNNFIYNKVYANLYEIAKYPHLSAKKYIKI